MDAPLELEVTLSRPATAADQEPDEPLYARLRVRPRAERSTRAQQHLCFLLDASASMHRFVLDPDQRAYWRARAEQRGEVTRGTADGRAGTVWSGQTLREMQQVVSTPMISTLRGVWRTLQALQPADSVSVVAFADQAAPIYQDTGVASQEARLEAAKTALGRLGSGVDESGLGRGTRLGVALLQALDHLGAHETAPALQRIVLVSDGIIEDREACRSLLDTAAERGLVVSVIGVGEDFDEEFLMQAADLTRGNYYYAATAPEVEQAVTTELGLITQVVGRQGWLRFHPDNGVVLRDIFPTAPALSEFQTMWVQNGGWNFRIGDFPTTQPLEFLMELFPPTHAAGEARLGTVRVDGVAAESNDRFSVDAPVKLLYAADRMLLQAQDDGVLDAVRRLEIYREERRAADAVAHGDQESATKHLRAATRMLRKMGDDSLADDMDAAAEETESGTRNLSRTKRVKAGTRRLGNRS